MKKSLEKIILESISFIAQRAKSNPTYPWINTKFSVITGCDFESKDPIRGLDTIYSWIQGRGIEALAGHLRWLEGKNLSEFQPICSPLKELMQKVLANLTASRERNAGHLFFWLDRLGQPIKIEDGKAQPFAMTLQTPYNYSDMFCSKGMYAAAKYLGNETAVKQAKQYCLDVYSATLNDNFMTDQQQLDPKNQVKPVPGRHSHGPFLIQIGTAAVLTEYEQDSASIDMGLNLIENILNNYVNLDNHLVGLEDGDFVEFLGDNGQPYLMKNSAISDPGHSLEFVGLAMKFAEIAKKCPAVNNKQLSKLNTIETKMPKILIRNFENGFQTDAGGICKLFDLTNRRPFNNDMPWWSLPETIRAAAYCSDIASCKEQKTRSQQIMRLCYDAFIRNYVRPDLHYFQYQTISVDGKAVDVIPATPDADPGYHTGLSLIDAVNLM